MSTNFQLIKSNGRFCLELNSHSLSAFQRCEREFDLTNLKLMADRREYYPFKRGAGISHVLGIWYLAKQKNYSLKRLEKLEEFLFKKMMRSSHFINTRYNEDDRLHIASRLMGYFNKYRCEKNMDIIAVEKGFSKVIYEDKFHLFVYSGRPDLVCNFGGNFGIGAMDHKSESRKNDIADFNNQFVGYSWSLGATTGITNYIGLQKDAKDNEVLRREAYTFTPNQIDKWKSDTIDWYYRITRSITGKKFLRSWNCENKYGKCMYYNICTSGTVAEEKMKLDRDFIKLDKPYRSW